MITMVGKILKDDKLIAFRMVNDETLEVLDIGINEVKQNIRQCTNLKIANGKIAGKNGKLERYGVVGGNDKTYTIVVSISYNEEFVGYCVGDNNGELKIYKYDTVMKIYNSGKLTNARQNTNRLSAIKGVFPVMEYEKVRNILGNKEG